MNLHVWLSNKDIFIWYDKCYKIFSTATTDLSKTQMMNKAYYISLKKNIKIFLLLFKNNKKKIGVQQIM